MHKVPGTLWFLFFILAAPYAFAIQAEVEDLSDRAYFSRAVRLIDQAKESITASLYQFDIDPARPKHPGTKLFEALLRAHKRKVAVFVVLNRNYEFLKAGEGSLFTRNDKVYEALKEAGLGEIYFADPGRRVHDKLVVIDREWVIEGSHNWSFSALRLNRESATLTHSKEYARLKEDRIKGLRRIESEPELVKKLTLENAFLKDPRYLQQFVAAQDFRAMALYLWLRNLTAMKGSGPIEIELEAMAVWLRLPPDWDRATRRRQLIKVLKRKLARRYGLMEVEIPFGQKARIRLLPIQSDERGFLSLPAEFFEYGTIQSLTHTGLVCYLTGRYLSETSPLRPWWSIPQNAWAALFQVSRDVIQAGTAELRGLNLMEVIYFGFEQKPYFENRPPNQYRLNRLVTEAEADARWRELRARAGESGYRKARGYARDLRDPRDPELVEKFLELFEKYPAAWIERAMRRMRLLQADNPRKSVHYVEGILEGWAGEVRP